MMSAMECVEVASSCEEREIELEKVGDDPLSLSPVCVIAVLIII
jgi:hypothetical protein